MDSPELLDGREMNRSLFLHAILSYQVASMFDKLLDLEQSIIIPWSHRKIGEQMICGTTSYMSRQRTLDTKEQAVFRLNST